MRQVVTPTGPNSGTIAHTQIPAPQALIPASFQLMHEDTALGFESTETYSTTPRIFAMSQAQEKCGKTHLAATLPGEVIVALSNDTGTMHVLMDEARKRGKRVVYNSFLSKTDLSKVDGRQMKAKSEWKRLVDVVARVVQRPDWRSLLIDTGGGIYDLIRLAKFGKLSQVPPHLYTEVNEEMNALMHMLFACRPDLNVLVTHKMKKLYKGKEWDGKTYAPEAWDGMKYAVDIVLENDRVRDPITGSPVFSFKVLDSRINAMDTIGQTFSSREAEIVDGEGGVQVYSGKYFNECTLPNLAAVMWPDAPAETWE